MFCEDAKKSNPRMPKLLTGHLLLVTFLLEGASIYSLTPQPTHGLLAMAIGTLNGKTHWAYWV